MTTTIAAYDAMYFENVAQAVDFCQALVPHIVARRNGSSKHDDRAVVWFHVPARAQRTTRDGCYLFASAGAVAAAERAGLDPPISGRVSRATLPPDAVLLFGDDVPPAPNRGTATRRPSVLREGIPAPINSPSPVDVRA